MAEVWAEMQTQVEETSRRLLPLESSNHGSLGQDKHRPNYTYAGTYTITARLTECVPVQKRSSMQNGSLIKANRRNGQEVWEFRWRDRTSGKAVYRRIVLGSAQQFPTEIEARAAAAGIVLEINVNDPRVQTHALTMSQLAEHNRHRELSPDNTWKSYSTKKGYENYLKRWIVPKWGSSHFVRSSRLRWSCGYASFPW